MTDSSPLRNRWLQLALAVLAMICIANLQYGWTLFVKPLTDATQNGGHHWTKAAVQSAFTLFVLFETWIVPFNGWFADRFGPKPMVALAGILVAAGWIVNAHAGSIGGLLTGEALSGIGAGLVYGTMVGVAVKWFPDKRGLAVGLTAAGFGAGAALTVIPIAHMIHDKTAGYQAAFQTFGIAQGVVVLIIAAFLAFPRQEEIVAVTPVNGGALARQRKNSYTPLQMLSSPSFYLLYIMMTMIATGLLFVTAQVAPMAGDYGVAAILPLALVIDNLTNGGSRILFGWISDRIGREATMAIAFTCEALGLLGLIFAAHNPALFIICAAATFLASGEIYSLFPASCTDLFGTKYATTNSGLLYTAKGTASFVVPIASLIYASTGSWSAILGVLVAFNIIVAALALGVLKPMRERAVASEASPSPVLGAAGAAPAR
ncbi:MAG TPA: oxalate/formate MFS antiporter [Candidatus Sulfotelmatobacter sp.]|nr:oxalate/formate MFS antiporter [Candidatus Sulfotelmatobacter sp.]